MSGLLKRLARASVILPGLYIAVMVGVLGLFHADGWLWLLLGPGVAWLELMLSGVGQQPRGEDE